MSTSAPSLDALRVLLIQARNTEDMEHQEQECFLERCRLQRKQLRLLNVAHEPVRRSLINGVDAVLIGGAGEYSALDDPPWMPALLDLVRDATARHIPTFGSCWGHQIIARAFGGTLVHDPDRAELGCGRVEMTAAGRDDPLFNRFSASFKVNMGHHDRVDVLPARAVELAYNDSQRNQAFRLREVPVYGTQFHSELDAARERERLIAYRSYYRNEMPSEEAFQAVMDNLAETTEVDTLLYDFLLTFAVPFAQTNGRADPGDAPPRGSAARDYASS